MEKGTINVGIEYYTDVVREHAIMQSQINTLKRFLRKKSSERLIYVREVADIFGFDANDPAGYQE